MDTQNVFVTLMEQFLNELCETFPEMEKLSGYRSQFMVMKATSPGTIVEKFMESMRPYAEQIRTRDDKLFTENNNDFLVQLEGSRMWGDEISENTKNAIWEYLNQLYMLGSTINAVPNELLSSIENVAVQMQKTMTENPQAFNDMLSSVMGNTDVNDVLGGLLQQNKK